jgi:hypothetical protein
MLTSIFINEKHLNNLDPCCSLSSPCIPYLLFTVTGFFCQKVLFCIRDYPLDTWEWCSLVSILIYKTLLPCRCQPCIWGVPFFKGAIELRHSIPVLTSNEFLTLFLFHHSLSPCLYVEEASNIVPTIFFRQDYSCLFHVLKNSHYSLFSTKVKVIRIPNSF